MNMPPTHAHKLILEKQIFFWSIEIETGKMVNKLQDAPKK